MVDPGRALASGLAVLTAAFALAYAVVVWLNASYVAKAMLRTPDLTVSEFARVAEAASDAAVVSELATRIFQGDDARSVIARDLARDPFFADHFHTDLYDFPFGPEGNLRCAANLRAAADCRRSDPR